MEIIKRQTDGVSFFSCDGFPHDMAHGFSTRVGGVSRGDLSSLNLAATRGDDPACVRENFRRFCGAVGGDDRALVKNHQVHGQVIRRVTRADIMPEPESPGLVEADGLVTDVPGLCLTIFSADCIPLLLCDPVKRVVCAAHAGWRGAAAGIARLAVETMGEGYGSDPAHILAAIGPGISPCCFETHGDVPQAVRAGLGEEAEGLITPVAGGEKFRVDLKEINRRWLLKAGLLPEHIALSDACTACDRTLFWSHRAQGERRGTMAAVIALKEPAR